MPESSRPRTVTGAASISPPAPLTLSTRMVVEPSDQSLVYATRMPSGEKPHSPSVTVGASYKYTDLSAAGPCVMPCASQTTQRI